MRFTIIGPAYPLRGGIAHHTYWLQQQLLAKGHSVQVISFRQLYPSLLFPGSRETDSSNLKLESEARPVLTSINPLTWFAASKMVKAFSPDLVVFQWWHSFFAPLVGTLARAFKRAGIRQLIECHNVFPHEGTPLDRLLLGYAFSPVERFITHSQKNRLEVLAMAPGKAVEVSSLPVLNEFRKPNTAARDGRTILFFGVVRKYKGLQVLLEALPEVLSQIDCQLLIVGEFYESLAKYQQLIQTLNLQQQVRIENRYVPNEEVPAIFAQADVLVLPYVTASQSAVAQVALSNALPVIASQAGGLSEAVTDEVNGLLFPVGDVKALATQIIRYFSNQMGPQFAATLRHASSQSGNCRLIEIIEAAAQGDH
jgi:glycosyltransferase involved in cell wall biosynthesis